MRKFMAAPIVLIFSFGCSQTNTKTTWTEDNFRAFLPQMESVATVLTQQALTGKAPSVRVTVNTISRDIVTTLDGTYAVDPAKIDFIVEQAYAKLGNLNLSQVAKPIIKSILLVGLQSAERKINEAGLSLSAKNLLIVDFVKATASGIQKGSADLTPAAGQFVLPTSEQK